MRRFYFLAFTLVFCWSIFAEDWITRLPEAAWAEPDETPMAAVAGKELVVAWPRGDVVVGCDVESGALRWRIGLRGPISAAPISVDGGWLVASDAGELSLIDNGKERWRTQLAPGTSRLVNAHLERLTSSWPVRGGPCVHDGVVYAAAGIHPVMGFTWGAFSLKDGQPLWSTDLSPATVKQPHSTSVLDVPALIGTMRVDGPQVILTGGRGRGWAVDRDNGRLTAYKPGSWAPGKDGSNVPNEIFTRSWFGLRTATSALVKVDNSGIFLVGRHTLVRALDYPSALRAAGKLPAAAAAPGPAGGQHLLIGDLPEDELVAIAHSGGRWTGFLAEDQAAARRPALVRAGLLGWRMSLPGVTWARAGVPDGCADLIWVAGPVIPAWWDSIAGAVRPFGGRVRIRALENDFQGFLSKRGFIKDGQATVKDYQDWVRVGPPRGSQPWGNPFGRADNGYVIDDTLTYAPLAVAWIGGEADGRGDGAGAVRFAMGTYQGRSCPSKDFAPVLVAGGRMFVHGKDDALFAFNAYTGRSLWRAEASDRLCADALAVYALDGNGVQRIDASTGKVTARYALSMTYPTRELRVVGNTVLASTDTQVTALDAVTLTMRWQRRFAQGLGVGIALKNWYYHPADFAIAADQSRVIVVRSGLETRSGEVLPPGQSALVMAFNLTDGRLLWATPVPGGASKEPLSVQISSETGIVLIGQRGDDHGWSINSKRPLVALKLDNGNSQWQSDAGYAPPLTLRGLTAADHRKGGILDLRTGFVTPPRGSSRQYGCAYAIGSASASFMRSGSIAYADLAGGSGIIPIGGMRGGCTPDVVPGDGMAVRPNLALGCLCSYPLFTSLGLQRRDQAMAWSPEASFSIDASQRFGWNLGAPGVRAAAGGTRWLTHIPKASVSGGTPFYRHPARVPTGALHTWVASSGIEGLTALTFPLEPGPWRIRIIAADPTCFGRTFTITHQGSTIPITLPPGFAAISHELDNTGTLSLTFTPGSGPAICCGIEAVRPGQSFDLAELFTGQ